MKSGHFDALWGAILDRVDLDVTRQVLILMVRTGGFSGDTVHTLDCSGLREFRFSNAILGPWEYAEITEIRASITSSGAQKIEIVLWSEDAGLEIHAETITLNGERIEG